MKAPGSFTRHDNSLPLRFTKTEHSGQHRNPVIVCGLAQLRSLALPLVLALSIGLTGCEKGRESQPSAAAGMRPGSTANVATAPVVTLSGPVPVSTGTDKKCLDCHGPFDKLVKSVLNYAAPSGEKISPHRYVPHDSKLEKDIPECSHCHTSHSVAPLPAKGSIDLSKVGVLWCFDCHHNKDFQSCKDCHP